MRRPSNEGVVVTSTGVWSAMCRSSAAEKAVEPALRRGVDDGFCNGDVVVAARAARPRREIAVHRCVAEFGQQRQPAAFGHELGDLRFGIAEVAEVARACRTHLHAGGLAFGLREILVVDAVDAERALLHDALDLAVFARAVRACPRTQLAADALVFVDE